MLHTDDRPLSDYFGDVDEDWDEPQPQIQWRFKSLDGYEDLAYPEDFAKMLDLYTKTRFQEFTVELEYTEPEAI